MMTLAASVINRWWKDDEGFAAYLRWKGRVREASCGVRRVCGARPALSVGKDEYDVRWKEGVWLGIKLERGDSMIGTSEGVAKARGCGRMP